MSDEFYMPFIPPIKTKRQKMELIQEIVRPKCADLLRDNGFVSYKNEDLCWYRIVGGEVLQAVYYFSVSSHVPLMLRTFFGCHPLFLEPPVPHPPTSNNGKSYRSPLAILESVYWSFPLNPALTLRENRLIASRPDGEEAEILERYLLPLLNEVRTEEMAYNRHKEQYYQKHIDAGRQEKSIPFHIAEEAVYMGDEEMYSLCKESAIGAQSGVMMCAYDLQLKIYADQMLEYFETGDRAKYLQRLEERKQNTLNLLKKKLPHGTFQRHEETEM